jgi:hypothetical protein
MIFKMEKKSKTKFFKDSLNKKKNYNESEMFFFCIEINYEILNAQYESL